eukprot:TRINITY_DN39727_c0_g1_i1.p1 TRINITY_DN39727_c0_g1~~TRINITY_DN39727_c0_g1_i1.p1  ORF type:complete len:426 (+),score=109.36 TRINITY_DN39727_c0_g1_i1:50-1279(+)
MEGGSVVEAADRGADVSLVESGYSAPDSPTAGHPPFAPGSTRSAGISYGIESAAPPSMPPAATDQDLASQQSLSLPRAGSEATQFTQQQQREADAAEADPQASLSQAILKVTPVRTQVDWCDRRNQQEAKVQRMLDRMDDARSQDLAAMAAGQPATKKLELLPEVVAFCGRANLQRVLIENGLLFRLAQWMKAPRGQLPTFKIRQSIVQLLLSMPYENDPGRMRLKAEANAWSGITVENLEKIPALGFAVRRMTEHPGETQENVRLASRLMEKWSRIIFSLPKNYKELAQEEAARGRQPGWKADRYVHVDDQERIDRNGKRVHSNTTADGDPLPKRCRLPARIQGDFIRRPEQEPVEPLFKAEQYRAMERNIRKHRLDSGREQASSNHGGRMLSMSIEGSLSTMQTEAR